MLPDKDTAMNQTIENSSRIEVIVDIENATIDRDENLAKIEIATLAIIFLVTVLGNSTVLLALWTRRRYAGRKKLSRMYFFILHLSIADLITAFLSVLPQLGWEVTYRFNGGFVLCKLVKYGQTLGPYLSSYVLMATAIDRHQAICYPLTYCSWTSRRSKVMVWLAWATSLAFCIPQIFNFTPSDGTFNEGHVYERRLTALFALRLYNAKKEFNLLFNANGFDKWDDIVIITYEGEEKHLYCFQLKHVTGSSNAKLRPDMFEVKQNKTKCICDLKKLFGGFQKIKASLPTMNNEIFRNIDINNINLILFTNMIGKLYVGDKEIGVCSELFQTKNQKEDEDEDEETVIVDLLEYKKKLENKDDCEEFFKRWLFSGSQANVKELDAIIKKEIAEVLNLNNDLLLTEILKQYLEYIDLWTQGKLNVFHSLTAKHIRINLAEILISTLEIIVPSTEMLEYSAELSYTEWNTITANESLIVLESPPDQTLRFVFAAIIETQGILEGFIIKILRDEVVDVKEIIKTLQENNLNLLCYLSKDIESNLYIPKSTKFLLWKLGFIPLVIKVRSEEDLHIIRATLAIAQEERIKIIMIINTRDSLPSDLIKISMNCLNDIHQDHIQLIYNKSIKLNGHNFTLRQLMDSCPILGSFLTANNVIQILTNNCDVGNTFHQKTAKEQLYHIQRKIPAIGLNAEILKLRTDILIIYGLHATIRSLEFIPDVDVSGCWEVNLNNDITEDIFVRHRIFLFADPNDDACYGKFKNICNLTNKNIHLIKLHLFGEIVLLQWIRTSQSIDIIRKFRISSDKLPKSDITSIKGIGNILSADPGYGKTEMMYQLVSQLKDHLVVFVTLADQAKYFLETEIEKPEEHLQYFFYSETVNHDLNLNMFNAYLNSKQIIVIFDGMDEISTECKNKVIKFIQKILQINIKIWITCRVRVQEELENEIGALAFTLNTFSESEQKTFLSKYNFTRDEIKAILNNKQGLLEIPLYLYMLCRSSSDSSDMLTLCEHFVQEDIQKYCGIHTKDAKLVEHFTKQLNRFVKQFALYNSFPKTLVNHLIKEEWLKDDIDFYTTSGCGLIRKYNVNDQIQYVFVHKEICDYIAAKALFEIEEARNNITLMEYLFDEKLTSLRYMFYKIILANKDRNVLRQAVLDYNYDKVSVCLKDYSENANEDFTTSLHLAAQWGRRHYYSTDINVTFAEQRCYRAKGAGTEQIMKLLLNNENARELINQNDKFLSWTPIQYADHSGSLEILELFSTVDTFDVSGSQLLNKMPQSVLLYFCIKYHYNNLFCLLTKTQELDLSIFRCSESENTLLHIAAAYGNTDVLDILLGYISHVVVNKQKETPLHVAAYGHQNVVSFLISRNSPLEEHDNKRYTPLHRAVNCGQEEIVKLLIEKNADLSTHALNEYSLLHTAAYCNNVIMVTILIESGASVNEFDADGNLPLHTAVQWNSVECIKILIDNTNKNYLDNANKHGYTPVGLAVKNEQLQIVKMLISSGAKVGTINCSTQQMSQSMAAYLKPIQKSDQLTIFTYQEVTPGVNDCWATFTEPWGAKAYVTWYGISVFIVPLLVLIVTYTCICREIWRSSAGELGQRQRQAHLPKPLPGKRTPLISRAKINTVKQTIAVIVMYIVCSTPFICAQLWATWDPKSYENPFFDGPAFTILTLLYSLNSCVNPWIYLAFNRELPRLLLRHYTAASKNYRSTGTGNSTSNSSGGVESTSLRAASRWPLCSSGRSSKCATRPLQRHYAAQYNTRRWIVTTAT